MFSAEELASLDCRRTSDISCISIMGNIRSLVLHHIPQAQDITSIPPARLGEHPAVGGT